MKNAKQSPELKISAEGLAKSRSTIFKWPTYRKRMNARRESKPKKPASPIIKYTLKLLENLPIFKFQFF